MDFPRKGNRKMKKLFFVVSALAALSLLAPSTGFAQPEHVYSNQVGLFMSNDGFGATGTSDIGSVTVFLVLIKPEDVDNAMAPYSSIRAFECTLNFTPAPVPGDLFLTGNTWPTPAVDIGKIKDIDAGIIEYVAAYGSPMPVSSDGSVELVAINFLNLAATPLVVSLSATSIPSIPGDMVFEAVQGDLRVMNSAGGNQDAGVFVFNGEAVAVESESFGSVKSLFR